MKRITIICLALASAISIHAQPIQEFRGVWVATVANLDWPTSRTATVAAQQADLVAHFDQLKAAGVNAILFQVRTEGDALYASSIEPWSYYLTGVEGQAPNPFWDPLEFAIREALDHPRTICHTQVITDFLSQFRIGGATEEAQSSAVGRPVGLVTARLQPFSSRECRHKAVGRSQRFDVRSVPGTCLLPPHGGLDVVAPTAIACLGPGASRESGGF
jgi:hypothetical protein